MEEIKFYGRTFKEIREYDLVLTSDIETGTSYWITRKEKEARQKFWDSLLPKLDNLKSSFPLVYGTGSNHKDDEFKELFLNPQKFEILTWKEPEVKSKFIAVYDPYLEDTQAKGFVKIIKKDGK